MSAEPIVLIANDMWPGDTPLVLRKLAFTEMLLITRNYPRCYVFQLYPNDGTRGFLILHFCSEAGNVTLYKVNTNTVAGMLKGKLFPQHAEMLSNIAITFIGTWCSPTNWLSRTFGVQRSAVHELCSTCSL